MVFGFDADGRTEPLNKHWKFAVGSGHAALAMRTDYAGQLAFVRKELGLERVRFHGIFDDDMHTLHSIRDLYPLPGGGKYTERSFRLCGLVYDNVLRAGMKPFVELGFMPKMLAKHKFQRGLFYYKPIVSLPKSFDAWAEYIRAFVRYLLRRYGREEVESWHFEVWNEPDLVPAFFYGKQRDYFRLYETTARAIKDVDPDIRVGGPASAECRWIKDFVDFCARNNVPCDFISTHQYAGDPLGGVDAQGNPEGKTKSPIDFFGLMKSVLRPFRDAEDRSFLSGYRSFMPDKSETTDIPPDAFRRNAEIVRRQAPGFPVYYTEWNASAIFSAFTNDTRKVSAYIIKTALDIERLTEGSSIWCFSDIFEEMHPFPEEFHGGFGMLTQHGVPKPSFYAVKLLNAMGDERYVLEDSFMRGEIGAAAARDDTGIQVMFVRQNMKNLDLPAESAVAEIKTAAPSKVFAYRIDEDHCNPYGLWLADGKPADMTPSEIENLKERSSLTPEKLPFSHENGVLRFSVPLRVNDACLVRVEF